MHREQAHINRAAPFLIKARADDRLEVAELRRANAEGQLAALQSQMDPHFLFNSLTTLRWLIASDPEGATAYTGKLAQVYRYILMNRNRHLVQLPDEIAFFDACFHLLKIRFGSAIRLQLEGLEGALDRLLVPPISLQVLLENAVKHNAFSVQEPLEIKVCLHEDHLEVANRIRRRSAEGARVGLANLAERYRLSMNREVQIEQADGWFRVRIPVAVVA